MADEPDGIPFRRIASNNKVKVKKDGAVAKIKAKFKVKVDLKKGAKKEDIQNIAKVIRGIHHASKGTILER
jgi:hypothetical protein